MATTCRNCFGPETKPGEDECWDCLGEKKPTFADEFMEAGIFSFSINAPTYTGTTYAANTTLTVTPGSYIIPCGTYIIPWIVWPDGITTYSGTSTSSTIKP